MMRLKQFVFLCSVVLIITGLLLFAGGSALAYDEDKVDVLVGFHHSPNIMQVRQFSGEVYRDFNLVDALAVRLPADAIHVLANNPAVRYIEPDEKVYTLETFVLSTLEISPWGIDRIFGDEEYPYPTWNNSTGTKIGVAVIDTGIDRNHKDLPALSGGKSFLDDTDWGTDSHGHGTHVAGTIAAQGRSITGVSPGIDLYSVKVMDETGAGKISDVIAGIEWAVQQEIPLLNLSLGMSFNLITFQEVCQAAYIKGHILIASAGNEGQKGAGDNVLYPAAYPSVIAVSASNSNDTLASFSSSGSEVELIAPGKNIKSTVPPMPVADTVQVREEQYKASALIGTVVDTITGPLVDCGLALNGDYYEELPDGDWIALIDRGEITFSEKVRNVIEKGAVGAIIVNNDQNKPNDEGNFSLIATDDDLGFDWVPAVSVSFNSGLAIRNGALGTGKITVEYGEPYKYNHGTSMAAPHVTGSAALAWSANKELTHEEIREILQDTAEDLGLTSQQQGYGLVRADRAVEKALELVPIKTGSIEGTIEYKALEKPEPQVDIKDLGDAKFERDYSVFMTRLNLSSDDSISDDVTIKVKANGKEEKVTIKAKSSSVDYKISDLDPGSYDISARITGDAKDAYAIDTETYKNVQVEAGLKVKEIDFILTPLAPERYTLDINHEGKGTVLLEGDSVDLPYTNDYEEGTEVELMAVPAEGWEFTKWIINYKEHLTLNTKISMDENKTVKAYFEEIVNDNEWIILPRPEEDIALDKSWRITFTRAFTENEIDGIVIELDNEFIAINIEMLPEEGQAIITPAENYLPGKSYNLRIFLSNLNRYKLYFSTVEE